MSDKVPNMTEDEVKFRNKPLIARVRTECNTRWHLYVIFVVSLIGFCYQFHQALTNYWQYKTTVSHTQEMPANHEYRYPGLTICLQEVIPHFIIEELYPEYKTAVEQIRNESIRRGDPDFWTKKVSKKFNDAKYDGKSLYKYYENKLVVKTPIIEILMNFSYGKEYDCVLDAYPLTDAKVKITQCRKVVEPIETINGDYRCFTYLSQLDTAITNETSKLFRTTLFQLKNTYETRHNKVVYVGHILDNNRLAHPFEKNFRARAMVHAPNALPVPDFYPSIHVHQWSRFYNIEFWKTISYLKEKPYETNCFPYKTGMNESVQSYDDCVDKCLTGEYRKNCRCLPRSGILFRRSALLPSDKFCGIYSKCSFKNYRLDCEKSCQKDCLQENYFFEKISESSYFSDNNLTGIQIIRKPVLDQVYRHDASMTFIQLVSDFGGLAGLWLEFSVITITTAIIQLIAKPLEKHSK